MEKDEKLIYTNEPRKLCVTPGWREFLSNIEDILAEERLVLVGSSGRWDGVRSGWTPVESLRDITDFLEDCDTVEATEDSKGSLHILGIHPDGRNQAELAVLTDGYDPEEEPSGRIDSAMLLPLRYTERFGDVLDEPESDWPEPSSVLLGEALEEAAGKGEWHCVQSVSGKSLEALKALRKWYNRRDAGDFEISGYLEDWDDPGSILVVVMSLWDVEFRWADVLAFLRDMVVVMEPLGAGPEIRLLKSRPESDGFLAVVHISGD